MPLFFWHPAILFSDTSMQCTGTCTDTCLGATTHLQVDCRWRGVGEQQHHEEEWIWGREYVPLVCQHDHGSPCVNKRYLDTSGAHLSSYTVVISPNICIKLSFSAFMNQRQLQLSMHAAVGLHTLGHRPLLQLLVNSKINACMTSLSPTISRGPRAQCKCSLVQNSCAERATCSLLSMHTQSDCRKTPSLWHNPLLH